MLHKKLFFHLLPNLLLFAGLLFMQIATAQISSAETYISSIQQWRQQREKELKAPKGWLNLEGLFWLHKGVNTFGGSQKNDCVYENPDPSDVFFPDHLGNFILEGDSVIWETLDKYTVQIKDQNTALNSKVCIFNDKGLSREVNWNKIGASFSWNIIKREEKIGVRFRNLNSTNLSSFKGNEYFPIDEKFKLKAVLQPPIESFLMIANVLGQQVASKSAGKLLFTFQNKKYSLDVIDEGEHMLFITFADATSGLSTYGSGRFIYIDPPDANGNTFIDFNKAFNPPCAFTSFATCPLPPPQNRLQLAITAGEKNYGHH
jgi:uncharacterized protein (DUF1684 family)